MRNLILIALLAFVPGADRTFGEQSSVAKVYVTEYSQLRDRSMDLFSRAQAATVKVSELREERLALIMLIHRLQEASIATPTQDSSLRLVNQGCEGLDFSLLALDQYLETKDRAFLALGKQGF